MYNIRLIKDNNILKFLMTNDVINWMLNFIPQTSCYEQISQMGIDPY